MTVNLDQILKYCNYLLNKNQVADSISPDEFNYVLPVVNQEVFNNELKKVLQVYGQPSFVDAYKNSYLRDCEKYYTLVSQSMTSLTVPTDYEMFLSGKVLDSSNSAFRKLTLVDSLSAFDNVNGMMGANDENVIAFSVGNTIRFNYPVSSVEMIYVSKPTTPIYDYCLNGTDALFLPKDTEVVYYQGEYSCTINGIEYQQLTAGYTGQFAGAEYTSKTEDFVWNDKLLPVVVNLIFEKMGINIREQIPIEVSQIKKAQ